MTDQFEIGLTLEAMVSLKSIGILKPLDEPVDYTEERELASGIVKPVGWPVCVWFWTFMSKVAYTTLKNFFTTRSLELYVRTRDEHDVYKVYRTIATFSKVDWETGNATNRRAKDISIRFTRMIVVEEETS